MKELSLRPYHGRLFVTQSVKDYERSHEKVFAEPDVLSCAQEGRFAAGKGKDGLWTYLVYAKFHHTMAHELSHVVLHVFERCGIDPRDADARSKWPLRCGAVVLEVEFNPGNCAPMIVPLQCGNGIAFGY